MYATKLLTSILFSLALLPALTPAAHALGCVNADISNQIKITGSKDAPGAQQNSVKQEIAPNCVGNVNVHKSTQLYVGPDGVDQTRKSTQLSGGATPNRVLPASVMNAGDLNIRVGTATTIYNPALDPNFMPKHK
jgi:hypothetical protein